MVAVGDAIGRRFYPFLSIAHRWASAFLVGLLLSTWYTYFAGLLFSSSPTPMFWANVVFFVSSIAFLYFMNRRPPRSWPGLSLDTGETAFQKIDWALAGIFAIFAVWMMFRTFTMSDGNIAFGHHQFPDFGSTVSIMQSFALGHNFPTEYPHFTGERIRYHFLFYFQAGNLEYLGLTPATANNILGASSLVSLLISIMTLGALLFRTRVAGRIGAALFFFHGSLSFIPFLIANPSFAAILDKLSSMKMYLNSGMPYRGEDWGVWSQNVFLNQRHFSSSIAIFLLALVFVFIRYREKIEILNAAENPSDSFETTAEEPGRKPKRKIRAAVKEHDETAAKEANTADSTEEEVDKEPIDETHAGPEPAATGTLGFIRQNAGYIFSGILLGLLPLWNSPVYVSAAVVFGVIWLLFPLKRELLALAFSAAVVGLPQIIFLTTGNVRPAGYSMFRWAFVIDNAGIFDVLYYVFFIFGFKWILIGIGLYFAAGWQRRLFAATFILFPLTFCFRFSEEVLANHKFLNVWLVIANVFIGFALYKLWTAKSGSAAIAPRIAAVVLTLLITIGGAIDLVPIWNSHFIYMKYDDDKLVEWVKTNTDPSSVFLSHHYINHQILLAGRKLFYGDPYYAWSAGYDTPGRAIVAKRMLETTDAAELYRLARENNIGYIAIDDEVRNGKVFVNRTNEAMVARYFPLVFTDDGHQYANIKIYKVPETADMPAGESAAQPETTPAVSPDVNLFTTTEGDAPGKLAKPRGITVDDAGNIYIADTNNGRVQKFDANGKFLLVFGEKGKNAGQLSEPNGVAVDRTGRIYVTDANRHRLLRYSPDGTYEKEWSGPPGDFYGPRDIVFGPNKLLYIIDQGGTRIARLDPATDEFTAWGSAGSGEGQFKEPTGIAVVNGKIYVADSGNNRIQIFDLDGKFAGVVEIPAWELNDRHYPDIVFDSVTKILYVTNGRANEILAFTVDGKPAEGFKSDSEHVLDNPSGIVITGTGSERKLLVLNTGRSTVVSFGLKEAAAK